MVQLSTLVEHSIFVVVNASIVDHSRSRLGDQCDMVTLQTGLKQKKIFLYGITDVVLLLVVLPLGWPRVCVAQLDVFNGMIFQN